MRAIRRLLAAGALMLGAALTPLAVSAAPALAAHSQVTIFEDDGHMAIAPQDTMDQIRNLGATEARIYVEWSAVAPGATSSSKPAGFDSTRPDGYTWTRYDNIVHAAQRDHIKLDFVLSGGAPNWAIGRDFPSGGDSVHYAWKPNATEWGNFVHATLLKFGKSVHVWEIYNEPNFGEDVAPQKSGRYDLGASQYRALVDAAWTAFSSTHHTHDTITIGQITARGQSGGTLPGNYGQTKPLIFTRDLYCVGTDYKPLTGSAARYAGCPTSAADRKRFVSAHPGLFRASGFGIHPYPQALAPDRDGSHDPTFVTFNQIPRFEKALDAIAKTYHAHRGIGLYNNEYGYVTDPPKPKPGSSFRPASPAQAAVFINQAEYLSWKDPRLKSYMQYLLTDPVTGGRSQFYSGLEFADGIHLKPTYFSFRMPIWLPNARVRKGQAAEVWGAARPSATLGGHAKIEIQWRKQAHGAWKTVATASPGRGNGYFDAKVKFPGSGQVQTSWSAPGPLGVITSRTASITVR